MDTVYIPIETNPNYHNNPALNIISKLNSFIVFLLRLSQQRFFFIHLCFTQCFNKMRKSSIACKLYLVLHCKDIFAVETLLSRFCGFFMDVFNINNIIFIFSVWCKCPWPIEPLKLSLSQQWWLISITPPTTP